MTGAKHCDIHTDEVKGSRHADQTRRRSSDVRHLRDLARRELLAGRYGGAGALMPSEPDLMREFGAGRNALRAALDQMRQEGLIQRVPGTGTVILRPKVMHRMTRIRTIGEDMRDRHARVRGEVIDLSVVPASPVVAEALDLAPGTDVVSAEVRTFLDGEPCWLTASYVAVEHREVTAVASNFGDWYGAFESLGFPVGECELIIEAVLADASVSPWLEVPVGSPLLLFERCIRDTFGRPVELGFVRCRGDRAAVAQVLERD